MCFCMVTTGELNLTELVNELGGRGHYRTRRRCEGGAAMFMIKVSRTFLQSYRLQL